MGDFHDYKPTFFMLVLQFLYAGMSLTIRVALLQGMSPRVFVVYRQAIATLIIAPITYFTRSKGNRACLGWRSFWLIFLASLIGVTINQNFYFEGIYLATSSMASAMSNLVPAVTIIIASIIGLEKINPRSVPSIAKIIGTFFCVGGAISMALLRGPKLLNTQFLPASKSLLGTEGEDNWLLGCIFLFGSCCCWSFWLILQVPITSSHPDHLSLTTWLCFIGTLQSAAVAWFFDRDPATWALHSNVEVISCFFTGLASAIAFFGQAWCIERRGPLFSAMFNPLCTVIVTIMASILLHEEIYTGSLVGAIGVVIGLYLVLWGKAKDLEDFHVEIPHDSKMENNENSAVKILIDHKYNNGKMAHKNGLEESLLSENSTQVDGSQRDN